jgi:hypothetical protein
MQQLPPQPVLSLIISVLYITGLLDSHLVSSLTVSCVFYSAFEKPMQGLKTGRGHQDMGPQIWNSILPISANNDRKTGTCNDLRKRLPIVMHITVFQTPNVIKSEP